MGNKRKRSANTGKPHEYEGFSKRQHHEDELSGFGAARGYIDASTGQRGAFPGLEEYGDDFFCGPANDGMDYLRMVRYVNSSTDLPSRLFWDETDYCSDLRPGVSLLC